MSIGWTLSAFLWGHHVKILIKIFLFQYLCTCYLFAFQAVFYKLELDNFQHKHCIISKFWHVHSSRNQSHNCKQFIFFLKEEYHFHSSSIHFHMQHSVISSFLHSATVTPERIHDSEISYNTLSSASYTCHSLQSG